MTRSQDQSSENQANAGTAAGVSPGSREDDEENGENSENMAETIAELRYQMQEARDQAEEHALALANAIEMIQRLTAERSGSSSSSSSVAPVPPAATSKSSIQPKDYPKFDDQSMKEAKDCVLTYPIHVTFEALLTKFAGAVDVLGLLQMLQQQRTKPVATTANPMGYQGPRMAVLPPPLHPVSTAEDAVAAAAVGPAVGVSTPKPVFVPEDDLGKWDHDIKIANSIMNKVLVNTSQIFVAGDPVKSFDNMVVHFRMASSHDAAALNQRLADAGARVDPKAPFLTELRVAIDIWNALALIKGFEPSMASKRDWIVKSWRPFVNSPYKKVIDEVEVKNLSYAVCVEYMTNVCNVMTRHGGVTQVGGPRGTPHIQVNALQGHASGNHQQQQHRDTSQGHGNNSSQGRGGRGRGRGRNSSYDNRAPPPRQDATESSNQGTSGSSKSDTKSEARKMQFVNQSMRRMGQLYGVKPNPQGKYTRNEEVRLIHSLEELVKSQTPITNTSTPISHVAASAGSAGEVGASAMTYPVANSPQPGPFVP